MTKALRILAGAGAMLRADGGGSVAQGMRLAGRPDVVFAVRCGAEAAGHPGRVDRHGRSTTPINRRPTRFPIRNTTIPGATYAHLRRRRPPRRRPRRPRRSRAGLSRSQLAISIRGRHGRTCSGHPRLWVSPLANPMCYKAAAPASTKVGPAGFAHDPEKWLPVFRSDHAQRNIQACSADVAKW